MIIFDHHERFFRTGARLVQRRS